MTVSHTPSQNRGRRYRFNILRVLFCAACLSCLVAVSMYLHQTAFSFYHARLLEDGKKTIAWFTEQIGFSLPFILICLFHAIVYRKSDRRDGDARREMLWEVILVTAFTYAWLLPHMADKSELLLQAATDAGAKLPETDAGVPWTLIMKLHEWFIRLSVPLAALILFHGTRARRERRFPETEACEPVVTVAEYEARKAAARAAEASAEEAASDETASPETAATEAVSAEAVSAGTAPAEVVSAVDSSKTAEAAPPAPTNHEEVAIHEP